MMTSPKETTVSTATAARPVSYATRDQARAYVTGLTRAPETPRPST